MGRWLHASEWFVIGGMLNTDKNRGWGRGRGRDEPVEQSLGRSGFMILILQRHH